MYQLHKGQQGFTLLELLVVITLLAILSVGALVAYEGIGENAADTAAANNIKTADSSIRAYRAVENVYPNQWDNLANLAGETAGGAFDVLADSTKSFLGQWEVDTADATGVAPAILSSLGAVGVTEFQTLTTAAALPAGLAPNEFFNESSGAAIPADEVEVELNDDGTFDAAAYDGAPIAAFNLSVVPSSDGTGCSAGGNALTTNLAGTTVTSSQVLNRINDNLDNDLCHVVVAVGFGKDVPGTTLGSRVAVSTAPTYTNGDVVNPAEHYARYIALFHVASDDEDAPNGVIDANEVLPKARLLAIVDTEGRNIDQAIAGAYASN